MDTDGQAQEVKQKPSRTDRFALRIGGGDIVIETFDDGSVRVNGDLVTPAVQLTLDDAGAAAT